MEETDTMSYNQTISFAREEEDDIRILAKSFMMYKIAEALNQSYFLVFMPIGFVGNILSFLVMVQPHNRHMSFSLYISALAVSDTVALLIGFASYLRQVHYIPMPPNPYWNCKLANTAMFTSMMWSTLFILSMTFERFYGIVRPHKAASFNTVKKAKITIVSCVIFSFLFNLPHLFLSTDHGVRCIPYRAPLPYVDVYYWLSFIVSFILPFIFLLTMNGFIIRTLKVRSSNFGKQGQGQNEGQSEYQTRRMKSTEKQIYVTLLLVTFGFLVLTTPAYLLLLYILLIGYGDTPRKFAGYYLFYHVAQKTLFTNNGINFFFYVMSGQKFRTDLLKLFRCCKENANGRLPTVSSDTNNSYVSESVNNCYEDESKGRSK